MEFTEFLTVRNLDYVYGGRRPVRALFDVSLTLKQGEIAALLGPNGCGKSTLLRTMGGLLAPQRGTVSIARRDVHALAPRQRALRIAFVPQRVTVDFPFTVGEVVMMGRAPHQGALGIEQQGDMQVVRSCMRAMRVEHLEARRMNEISGGEAQRVILAQALAQETPLLLLDEPTSHLDIKFQVEIMEILTDLNRQRRLTVLVSLHDLNLAAAYCSRMFLMSQGAIVAEGSSKEVLTEHVLTEVYGTRVRVAPHPDQDHPLVTLVTHAAQRSQEDAVPAEPKLTAESGL